MIYKKLLIHGLALILSLTSFSVNAQQPLERSAKLLDDYIGHVRRLPSDSPWSTVGRNEFLAKAVVMQLATLRPDEFNLFLFHMMDKYVNQPEDRAAIKSLADTLGVELAADFEASKMLQNGPLQYVIRGAYSYGAWLMLAGAIGWKFIFARSQSTAEFLRQIRQRELTLNQKGRFASLGYRVATSPTTWIVGGSLGLGALGGYIEYVLKSNSTYRINPATVLMVVQAQLACDLSYQALTIQEKFESLMNDSDQLEKEYGPMLTEIRRIRAEAQGLSEQWPRLENLDVQDRLFAEVLEQFPQSENWRDFRKALSEAETSRDGRCRQMSMLHLNQELEKLESYLTLTFGEPTEAEIKEKP